MKTFSLSCVLLAVAASAAEDHDHDHDHKKSYTGVELINGDKSLISASYTDWKIEGTGDSQTMTQWMVLTATWGKDTETLETGEEVQVY